MTTDTLYGDGLCARATWFALRHVGLRPTVLTEAEDATLAEVVVSSAWRQDAPVAHRGVGGLSRYYHGLSDLASVMNPDFAVARQVLGIPTISVADAERFSWVPWRPVRLTPIPSRRVPSERFETAPPGERSTFLCLSVIGNLQRLMRWRMIPTEVTVGDHLVVKLGTIRADEIRERLPRPLQAMSRYGALFQHDDCRKTETRYFFRPTYVSAEQDLDFASTLHGRIRFIRRNLSFGKVLEGLYLKSTWPRIAKTYTIYGQICLDDAYVVSPSQVRDHPHARDQSCEMINQCQTELADRFDSFIPYQVAPRQIIPGIHLYYDRGTLRSLPESIRVLDTSMNPVPRAHPSLTCALLSFRQASEMVSSDRAAE